MAFLKRSRRRKNGENYESWSIVESVRSARGPRQRTIAVLGKAPGLDSEDRVGWEDVARQLSGQPVNPQDLFAEAKPAVPDWATIDLSSVGVERLRCFGDVFLGVALWKRLKLDEFFVRHLPQGRQSLPWDVMVCIHAVARLCSASSDLAIADWFDKTALDDLLGVNCSQINESRLYRTLDELEPCREALFGHLKQIYGELFGSAFDVLLYDVTSTYFEGSCFNNKLAKRGYSRDSRPDCMQVTIGLVVTPDGLPVAYEVFDGNRPDVTTLGDIFDLMTKKYGKARRTWVLDRGIVSEENLACLRRAGADYIVGTPRIMLSQCEKELTDQNWHQVEDGIEVKIVSMPAGHDEDGSPDPAATEVFLLCRSRQRIQKDRAIVRKAAQKLESELLNLEKQIDSGRLRDRSKAERRIGRLLSKYSRANRMFQNITIEEISDPNKPGKKRLRFDAIRSLHTEEQMALRDGCYLLRSNLSHRDPAELWRTYIGLTSAEDAFRQLKSPLGMRPIFHQKDHRVCAHILICFVALAMRRTLALWMESSALANSPQKLLNELGQVRSMDVVFNSRDNTQIRLRVVSTPEEHLRILLHHLKLRLPNRPKRISNVVATSVSKRPAGEQNQSSASPN